MIRIEVAGFRLGLNTCREAVMRKRMAANYAPFLRPDTGEDELLLTADLDTPAAPLGEPLKRFDYDLTADTATMEIFPGSYRLTIHYKAGGRDFSITCPAQPDNRGVYRYLSDMTLQGIAPPCHIVDHLLIFALSVAAADRGMLLIHASTIVHCGCAAMFLGESGTGKSTHSRMWLENIPGTTLLNDDAPAVRVQDGKAIVYGTPWSGKTPCYRDEAMPLAAMVRIRRAPYNKLTRLGTLHAFGATLPSCLPTLQQNDGLLSPVCDTLSALLAAVPVYTMECLPDADAARTACAGLFH